MNNERETMLLDDAGVAAAVKLAVEAIDDKMGEDIVTLDLRGVSPLADYFVIASANNTNQLKAMMENVEEALEKNGIFARHIEGVAAGNWILMDFAYIVVHLFLKEDREHYRLDKLWGDARHIEIGTTEGDDEQ
ncbi:MAG: ribosome silencing factor [Defluviitaleaceae bacterium]|nr:ribosome silencing factor [Defluviitaleaceae bacterium]